VWPSKNVAKFGLVLVAALLCGAFAGIFTPGQISHGTILHLAAPPSQARSAKRANFQQAMASPDARHLADWILSSGDNHAMPFLIVDKVDAKVFLFAKDGQIRGEAPVLIGLARGDDIPPSKGDRIYSHLRPEERITPAGRFVGAMGYDNLGKKVLWVDYDDDIALHPVITAFPKERRLARLATPSALDNRISYGCINVPANFFRNIVMPVLGSADAVIYVLPESRPIHAVFAHYYEVRSANA
jgi:hypothetical protein